MKVKTIKNFHSLHNKALDNDLREKLCVCVCFFLSFFFYQF